MIQKSVIVAVLKKWPETRCSSILFKRHRRYPENLKSFIEDVDLHSDGNLTNDEFVKFVQCVWDAKAAVSFREDKNSMLDLLVSLQKIIPEEKQLAMRWLHISHNLTDAYLIPLMQHAKSFAVVTALIRLDNINNAFISSTGGKKGLVNYKDLREAIIASDNPSSTPGLLLRSSLQYPINVEEKNSPEELKLPSHSLLI